jgi:hypothetical protein
MLLGDPRLPLISKGFLKATKGKDEFSFEEISEYTRIPLEDIPILLESLYRVAGVDNPYDLRSSRFKVFTFLTESSSNLEDAASLLRWREFESFTSMILSHLGFDTVLGYRFSFSNRRWEIDVLGFREPIVVAVDCKHMRRGYSGMLSRSIRMHKARVEAFAHILRCSFHRIVDRWRIIRVIPVIVTLKRSAHTIVDGVPVVHISALRDFIDSALPILVFEGGLSVLEV